LLVLMSQQSRIMITFMENNLFLQGRNFFLHSSIFLFSFERCKRAQKNTGFTAKSKFGLFISKMFSKSPSESKEQA
jgi:hypothetical protein